MSGFTQTSHTVVYIYLRFCVEIKISTHECLDVPRSFGYVCVNTTVANIASKNQPRTLQSVLRPTNCLLYRVGMIHAQHLNSTYLSPASQGHSTDIGLQTACSHYSMTTVAVAYSDDSCAAQTPDDANAVAVHIASCDTVGFSMSKIRVSIYPFYSIQHICFASTLVESRWMF